MAETNMAEVHELFVHVRTVIGVILGLSVGKLLQGVAGIIEQPGRYKLWWVHLGWAFWAVVFVIGFWWWEFHLNQITDWTIGKYFFLFLYAGLYYLICTILFPASMQEYSGYQEYFISRRHWFFGMIAATALMDLGDTLLKGRAYSVSLGPVYLAHVALLLALALAGARARRPAVHAAILVLAIANQLGWVFMAYGRLF